MCQMRVTQSCGCKASCKGEQRVVVIFCPIAGALGRCHLERLSWYASPCGRCGSSSSLRLNDGRYRDGGEVVNSKATGRLSAPSSSSSSSLSTSTSSLLLLPANVTVIDLTRDPAAYYALSSSIGRMSSVKILPMLPIPTDAKSEITPAPRAVLAADRLKYNDNEKKRDLTTDNELFRFPSGSSGSSSISSITTTTTTTTTASSSSTSSNGAAPLSSRWWSSSSLPTSPFSALEGESHREFRDRCDGIREWPSSARARPLQTPIKGLHNLIASKMSFFGN